MTTDAQFAAGASDPLRHLRLLTLRQVLEIVPYTPQHIYRLEATGKFPRRIKLGEGGRVAWRLVEIEAWLASRPLADLPSESDWG